MRRSETEKLSEILKKAIQDNKLSDGIDKVRFKSLWLEFAGYHISKATTELYVSKSVLYVSLNSSILRSELLLIRSELVKKINKELGRKFI
ncbi:MAG TPA: DUF721 domain-containing protein, partial [Bacteroidales bacterium]|nr:DUF721 domain-containing protein [Bacteroidales bacterium]